MQRRESADSPTERPGVPGPPRKVDAEANTEIGMSNEPREREPRDGTPHIPGFAVERELGRGGMGVVYLARQMGLDRLVALKMILRADFASDEQKLRFKIEAENAARIQHPNIAQVYEIGEHEGLPYFALEYVSGGSLADMLQELKLQPRQAAELVETLARAVHAAHVQGIIHRDLKPANVLVNAVSIPDRQFRRRAAGPNGCLDLQSVKITDFGLAKRVGQTGMTASGAVLGTPAYMAPEQAAGKTKSLGPSVDTYALGVILYESLTGRVPFEGDMLSVLVNKAERVAPSPRSLGIAVPRDLELICLKCLEKDPSQRYPSADALADDLRNWLEHRPIVARPAGPIERTVKWCRRYPAAAALITIALLAATISGGLALWAVGERNDKERARREAENGVEILGSLFEDLDPHAEEVEAKPLRAILGERLTQAAQQLDSGMITDPLVRARLLRRLSESQIGLGYPNEALPRLAVLYRTFTQSLGENHEDALETERLMGVAQVSAGRHNEGCDRLERTLSRARALPGNHHRLVLLTMNGLCIAYGETGRHVEELKLNGEALELARVSLGPNAPLTLTFLANQAAGYLELGEVDRALPLAMEALERNQVVRGREAPITLTAMNTLAQIQIRRGMTGEAVRLYDQLLPLARTRLGPDHPLMLRALTNAADAYSLDNRQKEALALQEEVLRHHKAKLGLDHPDTHMSMYHLAAIYERMGRDNDALALAEDTLRLHLKLPAPNERNTTLYTQQCAVLLFRTKAFERAVGLFQQAETLWRRQPRDSIRYAIDAHHHIGLCLAAQQHFAEAEPYLEKSLRELCAAPEVPHSWYGVYYRRLADLYANWGKTDQVHKLKDQQIEFYQKRIVSLPLDADDRMHFLGELAHLLLEVNRFDEAAECWRQLYQVRVKKLGVDHHMTVDAQNHTGLWLVKLGRFSEAEPYLLQSQAAAERTKQAPVSWRIAYCERLADLYERWGQPEKAKHWRREASAMPQSQEAKK